MSAIEEVGAFDAKTHLSALLQRVQAGERFFITRHGKRVAELRPVREASSDRKAGSLEGKIWMAPDFDEPIDAFGDYLPEGS